MKHIYTFLCLFLLSGVRFDRRLEFTGVGRLADGELRLRLDQQKGLRTSRPDDPGQPRNRRSGSRVELEPVLQVPGT